MRNVNQKPIQFLFDSNEPIAPMIDPSQPPPEPKAKIEKGSPNPNPDQSNEPIDAKSYRIGDYSDEDINKPVQPGSGLDGAIKQYIKEEAVDEDEEKAKPDEEGKADDQKEPDTPAEPPTPKLEDMDAPTLIEEVKKNQRLVTERDTTLTELQSKLKEYEDGSQEKADPEMRQFIDDLKNDPLKAWAKHKEKYKLPDVGLLKSALGTDNDEKILQWQRNTLNRDLEKKYGLQDGEFEVVEKDLYTPKTPSYDWRKATEAKERELGQALADTQRKERERVETIQANEAVEIKYYADTFLDGNIDVARSKVQELNSIPQKIANGELQQHDHPFSVRNLLRGVNYEENVAKERESAQLDIIKQFNDKGMFLSAKELPTNLSSTGTGEEKNKDEIKVASEEEMKNSPMYRTMFQDLTK